MYDIISRLERMEEVHPNTIPVLGGARFAIEHTENFAEFVSYLPTVVHNAQFFGWAEGIANALKTFCHLCLVDPMLIEVYLGMTFEQLVGD